MHQLDMPIEQDRESKDGQDRESKDEEEENTRRHHRHASSNTSFFDGSFSSEVDADQEWSVEQEVQWAARFGQGSIGAAMCRSMCCCCEKYSKKYILRRRRDRFLNGHKAVEGFDYSRLDSRIERDAYKKRASTPYYYKFRAAKRWILISAIAILTGFVAVFMTVCTRRLSELRFQWLSLAFQSNGVNGSNQVLEAFARNLLFAVSFAVLGYLIASREPMSHGGGLTKVKALLNGIKVPKAVRATTLLCKIFGTLFTVISGFPAGKLAPLIHCGAIVGGGLSQGKTFKCNGRKFKFSIVGRRDFRNDREKRGFVTMGTAAGVASAFGAPIGGVLLCLEEGASWWSPRLNWRMTFCAMATSFVTSVLLSCVDRNGAFHPEQISEVNQPGVFSFGKFKDDEYSWAELPLFACLGIWGGLVGAAFNTLYIRLYAWRKAHITSVSSRLLEVIAISTLISIFAFFIPLAVPACHSDLNRDNETHSKFVQQFTCIDEDEYSETASMFLLPPTSTVRWIMHTDGNFDPTSLLLFFFVNTLMACVMMSGISLSGGRFVPLLASGVAFGRFFGQTVANPLNTYLLNRDRTIGLYALLGGAALVGGVERMVLSLTVILTEATSNVRFGLPLLVTLIFARWVGHFFFHESLNNTLIDLNPSLPYVPWHPPRWYDKLGVRHIMSKAPITIRAFEKASVLLQVLQGTTHNCFPVVVYEESSKSRKRRLVGCVMRKHLLVLLSEKFKSKVLRKHSKITEEECSSRKIQRKLSMKSMRRFRDEFPEGENNNNIESDGNVRDPPELVTFDEFENLYPKFVRLEDIHLTEQEGEMYLDLTQYMSIPHTVQLYASLTRAFNVFKRLELRHLCVVNMSGDVLGLVTRHDLSLEFCKDRAIRLEKEGSDSPRRNHSIYLTLL